MSLVVARLGRPIAEAAPSHPPDTAQSFAEIISLNSPGFASERYVNAQGTAGTASTAWYAANCPFAVPFVLDAEIVVKQLGWYNGSAAGDNADIGIYNAAWTRLVSAGSTACTGNSTYQFADVADTVIPPGRHYLVYVRDTTTANRVVTYTLTTAALGTLCGFLQSATTAFPLPDPLTNMAVVTTAANLPPMFIATRALV